VLFASKVDRGCCNPKTVDPLIASPWCFGTSSSENAKVREAGKENTNVREPVVSQTEKIAETKVQKAETPGWDPDRPAGARPDHAISHPSPLVTALSGPKPPTSRWSEGKQSALQVAAPARRAKRRGLRTRRRNRGSDPDGAASGPEPPGAPCAPSECSSPPCASSTAPQRLGKPPARRRAHRTLQMVLGVRELDASMTSSR